MTTASGSAADSTSTAAPDPARAPAAAPAIPALIAPNGPWLTAALLLAGAAQLIVISALLSADPLAVTWASLLLAIAPAPLAAAAAVAPAAAGLPAAAVGVAALAAGIIGEITHIGLFFLPALVLLAIGGAKLWRGRS